MRQHWAPAAAVAECDTMAAVAGERPPDHHMTKKTPTLQGILHGSVGVASTGHEGPTAAVKVGAVQKRHREGQMKR